MLRNKTGQLFKDYYEKLNEFFGTRIPYEEGNLLVSDIWNTLFDVYTEEELKEFADELGERYDVVLNYDTVYSIVYNGEYVYFFFKEVNYDFLSHRIRGDFNKEEEREILRLQKLQFPIEKYAVISYWNEEIGRGDAQFWLYDTEKEAINAMERLWQKSYNLALNDETFNEEESYHEEKVAVVSWYGELRRFFKVVAQSEKEEIF